MNTYPLLIEQKMQRFYRTLKERDRRRYAAIEALKLGHGGVEYITTVLGCDAKTVSKGVKELEATDELNTPCQRKKGVDANA
jgi:hypothetical protein